MVRERSSRVLMKSMLVSGKITSRMGKAPTLTQMVQSIQVNGRMEYFKIRVIVCKNF